MRNPCTIWGAGVERSPEGPVADISQVYGLADIIEDRYRLMVLLDTFCGFRLGELLSLRRDRIDVLHRRVIVSDQMQELADGTRHCGPPKPTAGVRTVALPPHLSTTVEDHLLGWVSPAPSDLIFTGAKATALYRATFSSAWDRARRTVGLDDFPFHDLRNTGNTLATGTRASTKESMARASATPALGRSHLRGTHRKRETSDRRAALGDDRRSAGKVRGRHTRRRTTTRLSRIGKQRLRTEALWSAMLRPTDE